MEEYKEYSFHKFVIKSVLEDRNTELSQPRNLQKEAKQIKQNQSEDYDCII